MVSRWRSGHCDKQPGGWRKKYIRGRRYIPEKQGLKGAELKPDDFTPELFATGVKHHITVIKKDRDRYLRVENADQVVYCHMTNPDLPVITAGRIGFPFSMNLTAVEPGG